MNKFSFLVLNPNSKITTFMNSILYSFPSSTLVFCSPFFKDVWIFVLQVKRYIDVYSNSSVIGFSSEDLLHIADMYAQAEENRSHTLKELLLSKNESSPTSLSALKRPIDAYLGFLASVAELARSKWTEFNLKLMGIGLSIMLVSLCFQFVALGRVNKPCGVTCPSLGGSELSLGLILSIFIVTIRACSFLSNSYIRKFSFDFYGSISLSLPYSVSSISLLLPYSVSYLCFCMFH